MNNCGLRVENNCTYLHTKFAFFLMLILINVNLQSIAFIPKGQKVNTHTLLLLLLLLVARLFRKLLVCIRTR